VPAAVKILALALALIGSSVTLHALERWKIQYLYDEPGANFDIRDLACPSAQRCVAAGVITDRKERQQGEVVVSSDGGRHWSQYDVKEHPVSLFFLNDTLGWMVTDRGLWSTVEGGRSWTKLENRKGILRTHFLDANHGYIAGTASLFAETLDGGKTWTARQEAHATAPNARAVNFDSITFLDAHGIVVGEIDASLAGADAVYPFVASEIDPKRKHIIILETFDSGKTWMTRSIPFDAGLARLAISKQGFVLSVLVYSDPKGPLASAVFQTTLGQPNSRLIFGERDRAVTDVAIFDDESGLLTAVEPPGNSPQVPIPGKLKILRSRNLKVWQEMDVDYRALAQEAMISAPDARHIWVATDTGAILGLTDAN